MTGPGPTGLGRADVGCGELTVGDGVAGTVTVADGDEVATMAATAQAAGREDAGGGEPGERDPGPRPRERPRAVTDGGAGHATGLPTRHPAAETARRMNLPASPQIEAVAFNSRSQDSILPAHLVKR